MIDTTGLQQLAGSFAAWVQGDDIIFSGVVTAFGGIEDCESGQDDGNTESGQPTAVLKDGQWQDTGLLGCALPIRSIEAATKQSPLAFKGPHIPWGTLVKFWPVTEDEPAQIVGQNTFPLVDNGPATWTQHVADLAKFAAAIFAPTMPADKLTSDFAISMNVRILGGAKFVS
jgi:hypothetical protein